MNSFRIKVFVALLLGVSKLFMQGTPWREKVFYTLCFVQLNLQYSKIILSVLHLLRDTESSCTLST